ncbi:MAG: methyltransferase domain-containing protein [Acidobacteria bacterium]|nr:methyltransferase domain-containing protein [Acidobacteriota bacterium]
MKRRPVHELLDNDSGSQAEILAALSDLRWFNRWFGGLATVRSLVTRVARCAGKTEMSLLEIASGEGYVPEILAQELRADELRLRIVLLDRRPSHLPSNSRFVKIVGDALHLPFRDASFDLVCSSLFLHHLAPDEAVSFVRECLRVSRLAVLTHDLIRHPIHLALAYLGTPLYRSRLTRNDAPASVWQAYTIKEMRGLCQRASAREVEVQGHYLFRMGAIAWK